MTNKKHKYDWDAMGFVTDGGSVINAFEWDATPQGFDWWLYNAFTPEGQAEFYRMKTLYAEDMASKEGPVRTVTKKEIVPGVYGALRVNLLYPDHGKVNIRFERDVDCDELTAAIQTLTQIRDAMKENE